MVNITCKNLRFNFNLRLYFNSLILTDLQKKISTVGYSYPLYFIFLVRPITKNTSQDTHQMYKLV